MHVVTADDETVVLPVDVVESEEARGCVRSTGLRGVGGGEVGYTDGLIPLWFFNKKYYARDCCEYVSPTSTTCFSVASSLPRPCPPAHCLMCAW